MPCGVAVWEISGLFCTVLSHKKYLTESKCDPFQDSSVKYHKYIMESEYIYFRHISQKISQEHVICRSNQFDKWSYCAVRTHTHRDWAETRLCKYVFIFIIGESSWRWSLLLWPCFLPSPVPAQGEEEGEGGEVEGGEGLEAQAGVDPEAQVAAGAALSGTNWETVQGAGFQFSKYLWLTHARQGKASVDKRCKGALYVQHGFSDQANPDEEGLNLVWNEDQWQWMETKLQEEESREVTLFTCQLKT